MSSSTRRPGRRVRLAALLSVAWLLIPLPAVAQFDPSMGLPDIGLVDDAVYKESEGLRGRGNVVERLGGGLSALMPAAGMGGMALGCGDCLVSLVEAISLGDGELFTLRLLSHPEVLTMLNLIPSVATLGNYATGMMLTQMAINAGGGGMIPPIGDAFMDPTRMFALGSVMMAGAAETRREAEASLATSNEQAQAQANQAADLLRELEETGEEQGAGGLMTCYRAEDLDMPMDAGAGQQATLEAMRTCVDNDELVFVEHRFEGTMTQEGQSRPFFIETLASDFRPVPGCDLSKPYRRTMRMGGLLSDAEMAEMEEARAQLAEFEAQLAAMPPAQRAMMEGMIGGQMQTVRNLANGGAFEYVQEFEEIICDADLRSLFSPVDPAIQLAQIQRDLVTLGYSPGNTDGVMDTLTEIAISQFEAESGMAVTGQPSAELALALSNAVANPG